MNFKLAWGTRVSPEFRAEVISIAKGFDWTPDHCSWLMSCMAFESAETFSPSIKNAAGSGAVGLIQFMPATAGGMQTSIDNLEKMTAEKQLAWVEKYFQPYAPRIKSLADCYMAILLPKYIGRPETSVLFSGGVAYRQNAGLDLDKDGNITKAEAANHVHQKYIKGLGLAETAEWDES